MKNLNKQMIVSGVASILLSAGIIFMIYFIFAMKAELKSVEEKLITTAQQSQSVVDFINSQVKKSQETK